MIKYQGSNMVKVYAENPPDVPGGTMISSGNYLGTFRKAELFFFDEVKKFVDGERVVKNRVTNVMKPGVYKKSQLKGI